MLDIYFKVVYNISIERATPLNWVSQRRKNMLNYELVVARQTLKELDDFESKLINIRRSLRTNQSMDWCNKKLNEINVMRRQVRRNINNILDKIVIKGGK